MTLSTIAPKPDIGPDTIPLRLDACPVQVRLELLGRREEPRSEMLPKTRQLGLKRLPEAS
jgi:hypothetical protein